MQTSELRASVADTAVCTLTRVDTLIVTEPDTAMMRALIECDEAGRVLIDSIGTLNGRRIGLQPRIVYRTLTDTLGRRRRMAYFEMIATTDSLKNRVSELRMESYRARRAAASEQTQMRRRQVWLCVGWGCMGLVAGLLAGFVAGRRTAV